jgi:cytochrome c-type biogenesis protein
VTLAVAFLGGVVSCLSPCVIPVIPVFAALVGGSPSAVSSSGRRARAAGFLLGFAGVFVALWVSLGLVGFAAFDAIPTLRPLAGVAIIGLGAATIVGWQPTLGLGRWHQGTSLGGSFLVGAGVAIGWTPCIGPTLGAIITLAAASQTVVAGAALLVAYGIGMAVPLAVIGLGVARFRPLMRFVGGHHRAFQVASGALIAGVGVLVATGAFGRLAGLVPWGF